jgi:hypothetical protein
MEGDRLDRRLQLLRCDPLPDLSSRLPDHLRCHGVKDERLQQQPCRMPPHRIENDAVPGVAGLPAEDADDFVVASREIDHRVSSEVTQRAQRRRVATTSDYPPGAKELCDLDREPP